MSDKRSRIWIPTFAVVFTIILIIWIFWKPKPPQMAGDEVVFQTVDALYTAVRERNEYAVHNCQEKLNQLEFSGALDHKSYEYLNRVVTKTERGKWESATEELYRFMNAQHRESYTPRRKVPSGR